MENKMSSSEQSSIICLESPVDTGQSESSDSRGRIDSPSKDALFDPSIDMLINDFDDERTLEEEEALAQNEDAAEELSNLEKEGDMPLEELLALYRYDDHHKAEEPTSESDEDSAQDSDEEMSIKEERPLRKRTKLSLLYDLNADQIDDSKFYHASDVEDDDDDVLKCNKSVHSIMEGEEYQAVVTTFIQASEPPTNIQEVLVFSPSKILDGKLGDYIQEVEKIVKENNDIFDRKFEEYALHLLHVCGYEPQRAVTQFESDLLAGLPVILPLEDKRFDDEEKHK